MLRILKFWCLKSTRGVIPNQDWTDKLRFGVNFTTRFPELLSATIVVFFSSSSNFSLCIHRLGDIPERFFLFRHFDARVKSIGLFVNKPLVCSLGSELGYFRRSPPIRWIFEIMRTEIAIGEYQCWPTYPERALAGFDEFLSRCDDAAVPVAPAAASVQLSHQQTLIPIRALFQITRLEEFQNGSQTVREWNSFWPKL